MEGHNVNWIIDISQIASHLIVSQVSVGGKHTVTIRATDGRDHYIQDSVTFNIILGM